MNSIFQKPWGSFHILEQGNNYLVKNLIVKPGGKLSLQSHEHRSEHWVIVQGIAKVTINEIVKTLKINESIYIHKKKKHRLENEGQEDLIVIEVQYGTVLQENDIIRYKDIYNRK